MTQFEAISVRLVNPDWANRVPSPAHDALTPDQRHQFIETNPDTFLAVTRSPEDLPEGADSSPLAQLNEGRDALMELFNQGAFGEASPPRFWVYQLEIDQHIQTGLVGGIAVEDYESGRLLAHEKVRSHRAQHLANHLEVVGHQSSPIAVAHRPNETIQRIIDEATSETAFRTAHGPDSLIQRIWALDPSKSEEVTQALASEPTYIIDGHHRAAAGLINSRRDHSPASGALLVAMFSSDQLQNRAFHRWLKNTTLEEILQQIGDRLEWREIDFDDLDVRADDEVALYGAQRWIALRLPLPQQPAPLANLDAVRIDDQLLAPILEISSTADSENLGYRPGSRPLPQLISEIDRDGGVLCITRPVPISAILDAADAGLTMPPKSTYFEPKVRSGVFVRSVQEESP